MAHSDADINLCFVDRRWFESWPHRWAAATNSETIAANWNRFEGLMDPEVQACYLKGQTQCPDFVAVHHWMAIERLYYGVKKMVNKLKRQCGMSSVKLLTWETFLILKQLPSRKSKIWRLPKEATKTSTRPLFALKSAIKTVLQRDWNKILNQNSAHLVDLCVSVCHNNRNPRRALCLLRLPNAPPRPKQQKTVEETTGYHWRKKPKKEKSMEQTAAKLQGDPSSMELSGTQEPNRTAKSVVVVCLVLTS